MNDNHIQFFFFLELFYYYEAMLSAAKNLSSVFSEFEVIIYRNYSVCWIDFNTCVFIRYFFETDYVQNKIYQCLEVSFLFLWKVKYIYIFNRVLFSFLMVK